MKNLNVAAALAVLAAGSLAWSVSAQEIPARPEALIFKPIVYTPPSAKDHRVVLKNGMVVFIAEDRALPLVNISFTVRTGSWLDPAGREGLAAMTGAQLRRGGTKTLSAEALDEKLDFLAAQVSSGIGATAGSAGLNCLADNFDESLRLFVEMLKEPRFQEDRLALAKEQALQEMKKRNDDAEDIEGTEWNALLYGESHFTNHFSTEASIKAITRDDLVAFHRRTFNPANMIAAVSGAFSKAEMLRKLEAAFSNWPTPGSALPAIPGTVASVPPGLYRLPKDVNQGRVSMGTVGVKRDNPDIFALEIMNEILGGSGFTSRITKSVRSNEGLAYSAGSAISFGAFYPGRFRALFQSKSESVALATKLVLDEIRKIREAPVTDEELDTIKRNLIETFPSSFASKAQAVGTFAADEYTKRDPAFWSTYRDRIKAVTAADVQRVAKQYLVPEKLVILVVGNQADIDRGDGKNAPGLATLAPGGKVENLSLRDPMTMRRK
jgi:predicted Zn-dependent peptidase